MNTDRLEHVDFISFIDQIKVEKIGYFRGSYDEAYKLLNKVVLDKDLSSTIYINRTQKQSINYVVKGKGFVFAIKLFQINNALPTFFMSSEESHYDVLFLYDDTQVNFNITNEIKTCLINVFEMFNAKEIEQINNLNPLLSNLAEQYLLDNICLEDVVIVIREHLLLEKLNLVRALLKLGVKAHNCIFVAKDDKTLYVDRVSAYLSAKGIKVIKSQQITEPIIAEISRRYFEKKVIVLDDGGDMIVALNEIAALSRMELFPIETTSKGSLLIQTKCSDLHFIDLANSSIKINQSKNIAISSVIRMRDILRHKKLSNEYCHVIGYGKIGRWIALLLREIGVKVTISEIAPKLRNMATLDGFDVFSSVKDGLAFREHKFVVGCSGSQAVSEQEIKYFPDEMYLVTVSSQDFKGLIQYLRKNAEIDVLEGIGDLYQISKKKIFMIAHGHAINLHLSEGVSEPEYDDFTSLMFKTVIEIGKGIMANKVVDLATFDVESQCESIQLIQKEWSNEGISNA